MVNSDFNIEIIDLHWLKNEDDPTDLCAHGHLYLKIGTQIISEYETGDWTLSSTALSFLRTIENNYVKDEYSNQLLPCCGYFFIASEDQKTVIIQGCNIGIDWKIIHQDNNTIKHIFDNGYEVIIDKEKYKKKVIGFADKIEQFFNDSQTKIIPSDDFDRRGYLAFWKEWRDLRDRWK